MESGYQSLYIYPHEEDFGHSVLGAVPPDADEHAGHLSPHLQGQWEGVPQARDVREGQRHHLRGNRGRYRPDSLEWCENYHRRPLQCGPTGYE